MSFQIISLTECWLQDTSSPKELEGYTYYDTKRLFNQNDGVVVYTKKGYAAEVSEITLMDGNCMMVKLKNELLVLCIYRPPSFRNAANFIESLNSILKTENKHKNLIITGDLNIDILAENKPFVNEYLCMLAKHAILPAINKPTRLTACLDHFMVKSKFPTLTLVAETMITDHAAIMIGIHNTNTTSKGKVLYKKVIDYDNLYTDIKNIDWNSLTSCIDVNETTNILIETLKHLNEKHTSTKRIKSKEYIITPWVTPTLLKCIRKRDQFYKEYAKNKIDKQLKIKYTRYRNVCNISLKIAREQYYQGKLKLFRKNTKKTWEIIKDITNTKKQRHDNIHNNFSTCDGSTQLAGNTLSEKFNTYFANVGSNLAQKILSILNTDEDTLNRQVYLPQMSPKLSFFFQPTDENEIKNTINELRAESAPGIDLISAHLLIKCQDYLAKPLTHICNLSISQGVFPSALKHAIVIPIYKSGNHAAMSNYRPISLLSAISKILEKIVKKRLNIYLTKNNLYSNNQFGFRNNCSTEDAVLGLTQAVMDAVNRKKQCLAVFLDLAKAFDTVSSKILLKKLEHIGIRGCALNWFCSYLSNRTQRVRIGSEISPALPVNYGVPQGSILGPILFLIYVNDLCNIDITGMKIFSFADDTALVFEGETSYETNINAEQGLRNVKKWLDSNLLTLNVDKTKCISFSKTRAGQSALPMTLKIHSDKCSYRHSDCISFLPCACDEIERVRVVKYLGTYIDKHLKWDEHIACLTKRVRKLIYVFKETRNILSISTLKMLYYGLCQSVITYCIISWGSATKTIIKRVEIAQKAVLKVMLNKHIRYSSDQIFKDTRLLTIRKAFMLRVCLYFYSNKGNHLLKRPEHNHETRIKKTVFIQPTTSTRFAQRSISWLGPRIFGSLINKVEECFTIGKFKKKITLLLLSMTTADIEKLFFV